MGKHSSDETSASTTNHTGRHRTGTGDPTIPMRADHDAQGRLTGFGIGRVNPPEHPGTYDSTR